MHIYAYFIIIQCAARITRHRAIFEQFCSGISRLWEVRIMIFGHFGGSRRPLWPILKISGIIVILGALRPRKSNPFLRSKCTHEATFCGVVFLMFFECSLFLISMILGALRLHFGSHFDSLLGALGI